MIKRFCDWCGTEVTDEDLFRHRGGPSAVSHSAESVVTGTIIDVTLIVGIDGTSNTGEWHVLCVFAALEMIGKNIVDRKENSEPVSRNS